jgi:hypothetical protein
MSSESNHDCPHDSAHAMIPFSLPIARSKRALGSLSRHSQCEVYRSCSPSNLGISQCMAFLVIAPMCGYRDHSFRSCLHVLALKNGDMNGEVSSNGRLEDHSNQSDVQIFQAEHQTA